MEMTPMAGTFRTLSCPRISLWLISRLGWVLVGALGLYLLYPNRVISYPEVIVPAARIITREIPSGPPTIRQKIVYVYLTPEVRAVAPGAVVEDVARFCRPTLLAQTDTVRPTELGPSVIRTVAYSSSLLPMFKGSLLVTTMSGNGDLIAEDFRTREPFGVRAGLNEPFNTTVRYSRLAPLRELAGGAIWYLTFRSIEAILRP